MYHLIVSVKGTWVRTTGRVGASRALRDWLAEEAAGSVVPCQDEDGRPVTKAALREVVRYTKGA